MRKPLLIDLTLSCILAAGLCVGSGDANIDYESNSKDEPAVLRLNGTHSFGKDVADYGRLLHLPSLAVGVTLGDSLIFFKGIGTAT